MVVVGFGAELATYPIADVRSWLPDLLVGLVFAACGLAAWRTLSSPAIAQLLAATSAAWFAGTVATDLLYLHRGPLLHLLFTYPTARPRSRSIAVAVGAGYAACAWPPIWSDARVALLLSAAIVVITGVEFARAAGRARRWRRTALVAAMFVALPIAAAAAATLARPGGGLARPTLAIYELGLCAAAVLLVRGLRVSADERVVDLVVELGETPSGTLRDRLARALGDPTLALGYWSPRDRCFLEERGGRLAPERLDPTRTTTPIDRDGERFAVLIHDAAVLRDPALVEAVAAATRLTNSNAALRAEVHEQVHELVTSRRHLLVIADRERRELEQRLRNGPERRLVTLARSLDSLPIAGTDTEHVVLARAQLTRTLDDLAALARGLHPRALADNGLDGALQTIAALSPVPVDLDVRVGRLSQAVETTVYFACAEALANVAKYAAASRASIEVAAADERLTVTIADDGHGGADPALGTGLRGLVDRFETLGGSLRVDSPKGGGTRLTAEVPLDASAPHA